MYTITTEVSFRASHWISVQGDAEQPHEHLWKARISVQAEQLDDDGLVIDFLLLRRTLARAVEPLTQARAINDLAPFGQACPSTERLARYLFEQVDAQLPAHVSPTVLTVWETPDCSASYQP